MPPKGSSSAVDAGNEDSGTLARGRARVPRLLGRRGGIGPVAVVPPVLDEYLARRGHRDGRACGRGERRTSRGREQQRRNAANVDGVAAAEVRALPPSVEGQAQRDVELVPFTRIDARTRTASVLPAQLQTSCSSTKP